MTDALDRLKTALADRYTIERELGQGGMATVYLAQDRKLGRAVALKVLRPELAAALGGDRFLREIEIAAKLAHPHILGLYDCGAADGLLYYTMPYVEGESLRDRLTRQKQLPLDDALQIAREVADALGYAHARGLVHRDIKPENILFQAGHAVVSDFGIARAVSAAGTARLTETGLAIGTPAYMSPEQAAGSKDVDGRSDLYSLGCVLYEMLGGDPPFYASTPQAVLAKKLSEPLPRISVVREAVPAGVEAALTKALARTPADRFVTAAQFAEALGPRVSVGDALAAAPAPRARARRWPWVAGGAAAPGRSRWRRLALFGVAAVVVVAGALLALRRGGVASSPNSVAVLYLANLSRDTADAFLADGLTEEIIIRLGQVPRLDVKSRFEVERFRGQAGQDPAGLGQALHAAYLVTGSVQRAGDRVVLRYEVIRAASRTQVAGDVIDRASNDLLTVESDIAREVATAITGQLLPEERARLTRRLTSDPVAYEEYLRGLEEMNHNYDEAAIRSALAHFDRAIARDSSFAAAFAGRAEAWVQLADAYVTGREGEGQARVAAARALALDSSQATAYAMLGNAVLSLDFDAHEAERLARRAVALDPRSDAPHYLLCVVLQAEGRMDEALEEARRACQSDSLVSGNGDIYVFLLTRTHRLDSAAAFLPRLRAVEPPAVFDAEEGHLLFARGDFRAAAHLLNWRWLGGAAATYYVRALLALGDTVAAHATVDSMVAARTPGYYNPYALARAYGALGDIDRGIAWLRRAFDERTEWLIWVRTDDELAPLRADPRYAALDRLLHY